MIRHNIIDALISYNQFCSRSNAKVVHCASNEMAQTVACTHIGSKNYNDANEEKANRGRQISIHSDLSSFDLDDNDERGVRHDASSFCDEERAQRSSSLSSITIPLEISCFSVSRPVLELGKVYDRRLVKVNSWSNPYILNARSLYVARYGRGKVIKVTKCFGRATKFTINFEKNGVQTLRLSRRPGQKGEYFFVRDCVIA